MTAQEPLPDQSEAPIRVAVLGGGSWGTTVAHLCAHNTPTTIWARDDETVAGINERHENTKYLPGYALHPSLKASSDFAAVVADTDLLIMGVPTGAFRETAKRAAAHLRPWVPVVSLAKGFEQGSHLRMTQILEQELPTRTGGALTGPHPAKGISKGPQTALRHAPSALHHAASLPPV